MKFSHVATFAAIMVMCESKTLTSNDFTSFLDSKVKEAMSMNWRSYTDLCASIKKVKKKGVPIYEFTFNSLQFIHHLNNISLFITLLNSLK